jgi:NhaA family Na+:H+ antiporter
MRNPGTDPDLQLPRQPIDRLVRPLVRFMHVETATGVVLLIASLIALLIANSDWYGAYHDFWEGHHHLVLGHLGTIEFEASFKHIVNDGLMVIFFFVIGLEVKRELVLGELRDLRRAVLPIAAAIGGMLVPAAVYLALQREGPAQRGWGIPMATDIAFVVGAMTLLGRRVPHGLRIMLLSLAIADDIGAILVIAIGYTTNLNLTYLAVGLVGILAVRGLAQLGVRSRGVYLVVGVVIWFMFYESGVHATLAGVILGLMTPARSYLAPTFVGEVAMRAQQWFSGNWEGLPDRVDRIRRVRRIATESVSPLEYLEILLHPWVSFVILPIFALANAGVPLRLGDEGMGVALAVGLGLLVGKPVGIFLFSFLSVKVGLARLPTGVNWGMILGGGCLAGIGFTMALFIAELALQGGLLNTAKIGILAGSLVSALLGMVLLFIMSSKSAPIADEMEEEVLPQVGDT